MAQQHDESETIDSSSRFGLASLTRSTSTKHKRSPSAQSLGFRHQRSSYPSRQRVQDTTDLPWRFQAAACIRLSLILSQNLPLPPEYVQPAVQSLLFVLGSVASPPPSIESVTVPKRAPTSFDDLVESDETNDALEQSSWSLLLSLLSGTYSTNVAHEIRNNLLNPTAFSHPGGPIESEAVKARGAARALRLALRQGAAHRFAVSRNEDIEDSVGLPLVMAPQSGRFSPLGASQTSVSQSPPGVFGKAVAAWLVAAMSHSHGAAEAVLMECVGIASDIVDECNITDRVITDDEAHIVGDILRESIECFRMQHLSARPAATKLARSALLDAVSTLLHSVPFSMPIIPPLYDIALATAEYLPDDKAVLAVDHIFRDILTFPSVPNWIPTIYQVFEKFHRPEFTRCRRAIASHVRDLYDDVRDLSNYRDPLVSTALQFWEVSLPKEDNDDTVADILIPILSDAIVAGSTEEHTRDIAANEEPGVRGLDRQIVDLLVQIAAECDCPDDLRIAGAGSDRETIRRGYSADLDIDRGASVATFPSRETSLSPTTMLYSAGAISSVQDTPDTVTKRASDSFVQVSSHPHHKGCKSMAAVLALIETFNRLAFSPPHSLEKESPFRTARAPASSKCINVFEYLISLLGPTAVSTTRPQGEEHKPDHKQASCRRARLAILQWSVRLRADRDHRLYFKDDLDNEVNPFAELILRGINQVQKPTPDASQTSVEVESDPHINRIGRSLMRRESERQRGRSQNSSESRSRSQIPYHPATNPSLLQEPLWALPDTLPFATPLDASRPSEGMTTFADQRGETSDMRPDLWLSVSSYLCTLTDIMEDETDWEIFSYALCFVPLQLSNKHLFCGPRTRVSVCNMVHIMTNAISSDRFGTKARIPKALRSTDVWGLACQTLTIFVGYRDAFRTRERQLGEGLVKTFCYGLNRHISVAKPSLQALIICAYEFESAMAKWLPQILDHLAQVISKSDMSRQILELLAILGTMPSIYSNLRSTHYGQIFTTAGRYIQRHHRAGNADMTTAAGSKPEIESFSLSQHVLVLAYYVIYIWYLAVDLVDRRRYIATIGRFLEVANDDGGVADEMAEVCFDWLRRFGSSDVRSRPAQNAQLNKPSEQSKSWLLGNAAMTIESLPRSGCAGVTVRGASGVVHLTVRVDNPAVQPFEEIDPTTFLPRPITLASTSETEASPDRPPTGRVDPNFLHIHLSQHPSVAQHERSVPIPLQNGDALERAIRILDRTPILELHKVGVMYVAPGQTTEVEILSNRSGSPAYTSFLGNLGHIIRLKNQSTVYPGGLDTTNDIDGEYAYVWWDEIAQIVFHATTMMPNFPHDPSRTFKKRHVGNDWVRIVWNDSGVPYRFDTLSTEFQLVNVVIEPHSAGITAAYSNSAHENEFFKVTLQRAEGVPEFGPLGEFKLLSLRNLPSYVRAISLLASLFAQVYDFTKRDTRHEEYVTNWRQRLKIIKGLPKADPAPDAD
ncbi:hypothetical protein DL93DRAFT_2173730 [Clavulina sp. PMI_390]|nr:hypothetical protein DL93DRAFT_2173730 [Clavulina sp. PMI_390]